MLKRIILKLSVLILSFVAVVYGMNILRSSDFLGESRGTNNAVALLLGDDLRPLNWCPEKVTEVTLLHSLKEASLTVKSAQELSAFCELMIGPVNQDQLNQAKFDKRLQADSLTRSITVILEQSQDGKLFRVQGMPFSSPMLEKVLSRYTETKSNLNSI